MGVVPELGHDWGGLENIFSFLKNKFWRKKQFNVTTHPNQPFTAKQKDQQLMCLFKVFQKEEKCPRRQQSHRQLNYNYKEFSQKCGS